MRCVWGGVHGMCVGWGAWDVCGVGCMGCVPASLGPAACLHGHRPRRACTLLCRRCCACCADRALAGAVIKESMRMVPVAAGGTMRKTTREVQLGGCAIPQGVQVSHGAVLRCAVPCCAVLGLVWYLVEVGGGLLRPPPPTWFGVVSGSGWGGPSASSPSNLVWCGIWWRLGGAFCVLPPQLGAGCPTQPPWARCRSTACSTECSTASGTGRSLRSSCLRGSWSGGRRSGE
jgi:hypothetical protein